MKLDSRLQAATDETRRQLSGLTPPPIQSSHRRLVSIAGIAAATALVVAVVVWLGITPLNRPADEEVYLGPGEILLLEEPIVVQGAPAAEARFNVAELGEEAMLGPVTDITMLVSQVERMTMGDVLRITVIGVTGDGATVALVLAKGMRPDVGPLRLSCVWRDDWSSVCSWDLIEEIPSGPGGLPTPDHPSTAYGIGPSTLYWEPAPEGTSVVVFTSNDTSKWQRPIGGVAVFDTDLRDGDEFLLTALDADGNTIGGQFMTAGD